MLRQQILHFYDYSIPFHVIFFPIIALSAVLAGIWPSLAAAVLAAFLRLRLINNTAANPVDRHQSLLSLLLTAIICVLFILSTEVVRRRLRTSGDARYRAAFHTNPNVITITRLSDDRFLEVNQRFCEIFGYTLEETLGHTANELHFWHNQNDREQLILVLRRGEPYRNQQMLFLTRSGQPLWGMVTAVRLVIDSEPCMMLSLRDITSQKQAEDALQLSEARYRAAFETSPDTITITRFSDGVFLDINPRFTAFTGYTREDAIGRTSLGLNLFVDLEQRQRFIDTIKVNGFCRNVEVQLRCKDGSTFWSLLSAVIIEVANEQCLFINARDISAVKRAEEEIRYLSFYDAITGLANRRLLIEHFHRNQSNSMHMRALLFLDLDNFKGINDTRGHIVGDRLLSEVARRLVPLVREKDTVARLGGDEFVVLLEDLNQDFEGAAAEAMSFAERILSSINEPCPIDGQEFHISCSIGITVFSASEQDFQDLLQQADIAMYQAKGSGRGTTRAFSPELQAAVIARAHLEHEIRQGIDAGQFELYYQPQINYRPSPGASASSSASHDHVYGAEALLRWNHPTRGLLCPDTFISIAENTRLILPLGNWVLHEACRQIALWQNRPDAYPLQVAVNISALQFMRDDFVDTVLNALKATGAEGRNLKLELTESILIEDLELVLSRMTALMSHGIHLSLDDFGTGYSCLAYLRRLPLVQIKIDRTFVHELITDPNSRAITRTIIELSRTLGLPVIAEGVETTEQRAALASLGCYNYQGYLFSPPLPVNEFEQWLKTTE